MQNLVIIEGYVANDPQFRQFSDNEVCNFVLKYLDYKNTAHWLYITCNRGEITKHIRNQGIQKNSWVHVQGQLATRKSKESADRHDVTMIIVQRIFAIDKKSNTVEYFAEIDAEPIVETVPNNTNVNTYKKRFTTVDVQCESPVFQKLPF
jgi:single-stranded DNA-binding protein